MRSHSTSVGDLIRTTTPFFGTACYLTFAIALAPSCAFARGQIGVRGATEAVHVPSLAAIYNAGSAGASKTPQALGEGMSPGREMALASLPSESMSEPTKLSAEGPPGKAPRLAKMTPLSSSAVPSLSAIYEASAPAKPRAFGDGALPLVEAKTMPMLATIPTDNTSLGSMALGLPGGVAPLGLPIRNARLTSQFGLRHHPILGGVRAHSGVDLAAPFATPIRATADGVVTRAAWTGGYGLLVEIKHKDGVTTRYGHMSRLAVEPGQRVPQNALIGYVGSTGRSTGPHLHYEVLVKGRAIDPLRARSR